MQKSIIAILLLSSAAAFANEAADEQANRTAFSGSLSRAEVNAGIAQAKADGNLRFDEYASNQQKADGSSRSRAEVRGEAIQAARTRVIHEQM
ncbi:DUF4148 domain-containing protein [Ramlibacter sp. Leaf400]|uniref:DUF4148 domain-containing protein n=1 Tax=Ramlibacter sp. Leaf400 TaxID=1736365 RepID=UPI0006FB8C16|nr:DUF4148 domain-containing protein [Ramlibacter sp. Leaf400]KQT09524.1 hypothetical protein ASG30_13230 [Ramlibacter sp. Leaf400]